MLVQKERQSKTFTDDKSHPEITCSKLIYFALCSSVSIVNSEQVNADWDATKNEGEFGLLKK